MWPGKLNNSTKRDNQCLIQPSRLSLGDNNKELQMSSSFRNIPSNHANTHANTSSLEEISRIALELKEKKMHQFGTLSQSGSDHVSFANLSENQLCSEDPSLPSSPEFTTNNNSLVSPPSVGKRPNTSSSPVAKHRRLYKNEIYSGSDIAQCLDYRSSYSYHDDHLSTFSKELSSTPAKNESDKLNSASCLPNDQRFALSPSNHRETFVGAGPSGASYCDEMGMDESNVNELASYLDDFLHIPKKMSIMAEMMYA